MNAMGHNESAVRLAALAGDAQIALDKVAKGEADATEGWLAYGAALNEGRALFPGDREFGQWVSEACLSNLDVHPGEQQAAMWAAANADQLAEARTASKARTLRGWHEQWKKIEQEREAARQKAEREAEKKRKAEEAETARQEAANAAKVEAAARAAAAAAPTDEARQEAEAQAETAAEAKAEAAKRADDVEAQIQTLEPETDPEVTKVMREIAKLTPEGVAGTVIELRNALADEKAKTKAMKAEVEILKSEIAVHRQDDLGRALGNATRLARAAEGRMKEHQATAARLQRQVNAQKAEITRLKKEAENQMIPL